MNAVQFPVLLPNKDHLTNFIIRETHARQLHSDINSTLTALRQRFWFPTGRYQVKKIADKCVVCKKVNDFTYRAPDAPPLTISRLQEFQPFAVLEWISLVYCASETANVNPKYTLAYSPALPQGQFI